MLPLPHLPREGTAGNPDQTLGEARAARFYSLRQWQRINPGIVHNWLKRLEVKTLYIEPGSPWENGYNESFNGKLRDEILLNGELFYSPAEARGLAIDSSRASGGRRNSRDWSTTSTLFKWQTAR
jgi:transposase InsO family protein